MENQLHSFTDLFDQLGLPSGTNDIQRFIVQHRPLASHIALCEAAFWTASQAKFLRDQIINDADWANVVDEFDNSLR